MDIMDALPWSPRANDLDREAIRGKMELSCGNGLHKRIPKSSSNYLSIIRSRLKGDLVRQLRKSELQSLLILRIRDQ